jgi:hypothetical protein
MTPADKFILLREGPSAVCRVCSICTFTLVRRKSPPGRSPLGRGTGMSLGNKQRGEMIQHIKATHPAEFAAAKIELDAARAERLERYGNV